MLMSELREKKQWIYNVNLENYTTPYGTYLVIEISTKNQHITEGILKIICVSPVLNLFKVTLT